MQKFIMFLFSLVTANIEVSFLALMTLIAGIIFGTIRHLSKSLMTPLTAHILSDILVYAECVSAPWWVW